MLSDERDPNLHLHSDFLFVASGGAGNREVAMRKRSGVAKRK